MKNKRKYNMVSKKEREEREVFIMMNHDKYTTDELAEMFDISIRVIQNTCQKFGITCKRNKTKVDNIKTFIYLVKFTENIVYIGYTSNIENRIRIHINSAKNKKHNSSWINKEVENGNFDHIMNCFNNFEILYEKENSSLKEGLKIESKYITKYKLNRYIVLGGEYDWIDVRLFNEKIKL